MGGFVLQELRYSSSGSRDPIFLLYGFVSWHDAIWSWHCSSLPADSSIVSHYPCLPCIVQPSLWLHEHRSKQTRERGINQLVLLINSSHKILKRWFSALCLLMQWESTCLGVTSSPWMVPANEGGQKALNWHWRESLWSGPQETLPLSSWSVTLDQALPRPLHSFVHPLELCGERAESCSVSFTRWHVSRIPAITFVPCFF